jgi:hypothetical protein
MGDVHKMERGLKGKLASGGDGGYTDDMERRLHRLETDVISIKDVLGRMEPMLARVDEKLKHTPSNWTLTLTMVTCVLTILGLAAFFGQH